MKFKERFKQSSNKKYVAIFLGFAAVCIIVSSCASSNTSTIANNKQAQQTEENVETEDETTMQEEETFSSENPNLVASENFNFYLKSITNENGNIKTIYDFENLKSEPAAPFVNVSIEAYQDGVQLESSYKDIDYGIGQRNVLPGSILQDVQDGHVLTSDNLVTIYIKNWIDFNNTILAEYQFNPLTNETFRIR